MPGCVTFIWGQLGRQCMCVGWLFDSYQNEVTVITDCEFNSTRASNTATLSSSAVSRTQNHTYNVLGELDCWDHHKDRKQSQNKCHSTKSEPSLQNTTGRNTKTLKILHIICILLATSVRKKLECTNRNKCNKTWRSYNMHLAFLTLLIREIQTFLW